MKDPMTEIVLRSLSKRNSWNIYDPLFALLVGDLILKP